MHGDRKSSRWSRPWSRRWWLVLAAIGLAVTILLTALLFAEKSEANERIGMTAFEFPAGALWLNTDQPVRMADLRGRVVLLDFWTYCCINCLHALPRLSALEQEYADQPVTVIGVHSGKFGQETVEPRVREAIAKYGVHHPVVMDDDLAIWNQWGVRAWPTMVFVDASGRIAKVLSGEPEPGQLEKIVDELLAEGRQEGVLKQGAGPAVTELDRDTGALHFPGKVLATHDALFVADSRHHRILVADHDGRVRATVGGMQSGFVDGDFAAARFNEPQGMALDGHILYVADRNNHAIRAVDLRAKTVATVAGTGRKGSSRLFGGDALKTDLRSPWALVMHDGRLVIAMAGSHQIWQYDPATRELSVVAGSGLEQIYDGRLRLAAFAQPSGLYERDGKLYVIDSETSALREIDWKVGEVKTLVGTGLFDFGFKDGYGKMAQFQHPLGVTGNGRRLYIADAFNNAVRTLDLDDGNLVGTLDLKGVSALREPSGLSFADGVLYVADTNNHRILAVDPTTGEAHVVPIRFDKAIAG